MFTGGIPWLGRKPPGPVTQLLRTRQTAWFADWLNQWWFYGFKGILWYFAYPHVLILSFENAAWRTTLSLGRRHGRRLAMRTPWPRKTCSQWSTLQELYLSYVGNQEFSMSSMIWEPWSRFVNLCMVGSRLQHSLAMFLGTDSSRLGYIWLQQNTIPFA